MTATLTITEILQQKRATEYAIAKLLEDLKVQTGCVITGISTTRIIGGKETKILIKLDINY